MPINAPKRSNCPWGRLKAKKMNIAARNSDSEESKSRPLERTPAMRSAAHPPSKRPGIPARPKVMAASGFAWLARGEGKRLRKAGEKAGIADKLKLDRGSVM